MKKTGLMQVVEPEGVSSPISKETANKTLSEYFLQSAVYADTGTGEAAYDLDGYTVSAKQVQQRSSILKPILYEAGLTK